LDQGFAIKTLAELPVQESLQKLYELYKATTRDIPGINGDYFDFTEWRKWTLDLPGSKPEYVFLALDGDRFAGVVHVLHQEATGSMYHEYTGVARDYRGKGIGMALKVKAIAKACSLNMTYMRTNNDSHNLPMLAINRDCLGFQATPGKYKMVKKIR
jgi:GNAT superfamily N-acetyltransferase